MAKQIDDKQVFESVLQTLVDNGYGGSTTKLIAQNAGINEVTLFRKYGSKGELVEKAIAYDRSKIGDTDVGYTGDLVADLNGIVRIYFSVSAHQSRLFPMIVAEMGRFPELRTAMRAPHSVIELFGRIIAKYQQDGLLKGGDPISLVTTLLGPIMVNTMLQAANPELNMPTIDLAEHVDRFLHGQKKG